jgi:hypothetical protein
MTMGYPIFLIPHPSPRFSKQSTPITVMYTPMMRPKPEDASAQRGNCEWDKRTATIVIVIKNASQLDLYDFVTGRYAY